MRQEGPHVGAPMEATHARGVILSAPQKAAAVAAAAAAAVAATAASAYLRFRLSLCC